MSDLVFPLYSVCQTFNSIGAYLYYVENSNFRNLLFANFYGFKCHQILKTKFGVMSYNMKLEKFIDSQTYKQNQS